MALANVGYTVKAVCPSDHPLCKTSAAQEIYSYSGLTPLMSFSKAILLAKPDLIIPGDDLAVQHLHEVYHREHRKGSAGVSTCALIERSIGAAESFPVVYRRSEFMRLAEEEGIRVPKTRVIRNIEEVREWGSQMGFPSVLKANGTSGGEGVRVVRTAQEAERAFRKLQAPPILARVAKRVLLDRDTTLVWPMLSRQRSVVNAQAFIPGREATSLVACWKGTVLAGLHFEVLSKQDSTGPASVVRRIEDVDMVSAAEKMVRRLNLSGLHGFDFMLEAQTAKAYLIEINPRTTQVGHLQLGAGRDLPAALHAAISGGVVCETTKLTESDTIAFFPQEWLRNAESAFLQSGYHDVPWDAPELVRLGLRKQRKWGARFSRGKWSQALAEVRLPRS
jgi:formate-dependent phosphoribosylglycinamide formyltransferase (GAR transformylase)